MDMELGKPGLDAPDAKSANPVKQRISLSVTSSVARTGMASVVKSDVSQLQGPGEKWQKVIAEGVKASVCKNLRARRNQSHRNNSDTRIFQFLPNALCLLVISGARSDAALDS